jgi:hypothetical protein
MNLPSRSVILGIVAFAAIALLAGMFFVVNTPQRPVLSPVSSQSVRTAEYDALPEPNLMSPSDFLSVEYPAAPRGKPLSSGYFNEQLAQALRLSATDFVGL